MNSMKTSPGASRNYLVTAGLPQPLLFQPAHIHLVKFGAGKCSAMVVIHNSREVRK